MSPTLITLSATSRAPAGDSGGATISGLSGSAELVDTGGGRVFSVAGGAEPHAVNSVQANINGR